MLLSTEEQPRLIIIFQRMIFSTITLSVIVENIITRNVIINRGAAEVDNHISKDDIFDYNPLRECSVYFIISNKTLRSFIRRFLSYAYMYHGEGNSKGKIMHSLLIIFA